MRAVLRFVAKTGWHRTHNQKPEKGKNRKALEEQSKQ